MSGAQGKHQGYEHPPITEAILEVRFDPPLSEKDLQTVRLKLAKRFPSLLENRQVEVQIGPTGEASVKTRPAGFRGASVDNLHLVICASNSIATVRLAPYSTWDDFIEVARENFDTFYDIAGPRMYTRIGVRYVNRIDVSEGEVKEGRPDVLFNVVPTAPVTWGNPVAFHVRGEYWVAENIKALVQTATVQAFLVDSKSFLLDIDLSREAALPTKVVELWAMIDGFRGLKNSVFEAAITDFVRAKCAA